jgi:hypothetical protein
MEQVQYSMGGHDMPQVELSTIGLGRGGGAPPRPLPVFSQYARLADDRPDSELPRGSRGEVKGEFISRPHADIPVPDYTFEEYDYGSSVPSQKKVSWPSARDFLLRRFANVTAAGWARDADDPVGAGADAAHLAARWAERPSQLTYRAASGHGSYRSFFLGHLQDAPEVVPEVHVDAALDEGEDLVTLDDMCANRY